MSVRSTIKRSGPGLGPSEAAMKQLARKRLLIGIPDTAAERQRALGEKSAPPSNAVIGYAMEFGLPDKNVPARPFLVPGVRAALPAIVTGMRKSAVAALSGKAEDVEKGLNEAGLAAVASVQATMTAGPYAPLSLRTIEERARRTKGGTKGAKQYLKLLGQGTPKKVLDDLGDQALVRPLIDTGQLRRAVTFIIKDR